MPGIPTAQEQAFCMFPEREGYRA